MVLLGEPPRASPWAPTAPGAQVWAVGPGVRATPPACNTAEHRQRAGRGLPQQEARRGERRGLTYFLSNCAPGPGGAWLAVLTLLCATL